MPQQYWRENVSGLDQWCWLCRDEQGREIGKIRDGPDHRHITGYDQAAVEEVLQRRWGKSIADLEAELQADLRQRQTDETRRAQAKQLLRDFAARDASTITQREAVTALQALIREVLRG